MKTFRNLCKVINKVLSLRKELADLEKNFDEYRSYGANLTVYKIDGIQNLESVTSHWVEIALPTN